jgi:HSP20 family protein
MARRPAKKSEETAAQTPVPVHREARHPLFDLRADMDRLFDSFVHRFPSFPMGRDLLDWEPFRGLERGLGMATPHVDLTETDKGYEVVAELPGLDQKDIDVELKDDVLTLSGEKKEEREETRKEYRVSERQFGSFRRSFRLPSEIDQNKISADFKNGVLTITLPKTAAAQKLTRKIDIKSK